LRRRSNVTNAFTPTPGTGSARSSRRPALTVFECQHESWLTSLGLRTLAPVDPEYVGRYGGSLLRRDGAYH
ncbi:MAG: hypothetical protein M3N13_08965, partial [Candidatus Eremiobacteraeota bacterium]|nr:hypothetical protein [Candidatus Eremiobacteraeota bacterium]